MNHPRRAVVVCVTAMIISLIATGARAADPAGAPAKPQLVILKADDFRKSARWERYTNYIVEHDLKASIGIICNVFEKDAASVDYAKELLKTGRIDFWHHGYDHRLNYKEGDKTVSEFKGTPFDYQKANLDKGAALVEQKLGYRFFAFGAPGNAVDETTTAVFTKSPQYKLIFYGPRQVPGAILLERWMNLEVPTFNPNSADFEKKYEQNATRPYLALQMHPNQWTDERFAEFEKIIAFLKSKHVRFVTAQEMLEALGK